MKKMFTSVVLSLLVTSFAFAQSAAQDSKRIDFGIGFTEDVILLGGNFDYAIADNIFVGGKLFFHAKDEVFTLLPVIRGSYYFNSLLNTPKNNFDLYAGIGASKLFQFYKGDNGSSEFFFPVHFGARYFFKERLGLFAEFTPSNKVNDNTFTVGISLKR